MNDALRAARRNAKLQVKRDAAADRHRQAIGMELLNQLMLLGSYQWLEEQAGFSRSYWHALHRGQRPVTAEVIVKLLEVEVE